MEAPGEFIAHGYEKRDESGRVAFVHVDNLGVITADLERTRHDLSAATAGVDGRGWLLTSRRPLLDLQQY